MPDVPLSGSPSTLGRTSLGVFAALGLQAVPPPRVARDARCLWTAVRAGLATPLPAGLVPSAPTAPAVGPELRESGGDSPL